MNAEIVTENTEQAEAKALEIKAKFDKQEEHFRQFEKEMAILRKFFEKHRETLSPFGWTCYAWNDLEIKFGRYDFNGCKDPKAIARAFGADGWTRKHNRSACGAIDWFKVVDGVILTIEDAENIKPKLIDNVKL
jgi:hypothetical protein